MDITREERLERTLANIPDAPGVYQMIDEGGRIIYIGKAISLRNRVRSYFQDSAAHAYRTQRMVERVVDVRTIVVTNEIEALLLETNLVKRHQPLFNVRLRDDKRFPYLKVTNEAFPRVVFTRTVRDDGARYFGPYTNSSGLRELIDLVRIVFPLRTCREPIDGKRKRPCLQYHIKRCLAPCVGYQSEDDYEALIDEVVLFLEGQQDALLQRLNREMADAAENYNFEAAARLRDRIIAVRRTTETQKVVWRSRIDMDLIASARKGDQACMQVFMVRGGKLIAQEHFILEGSSETSEPELVRDFLQQFYTARTASNTMEAAVDSVSGSPLALRDARANEAPVALKERARKRLAGAAAAAIPKEILVQAAPEEGSVIEAWLTEFKGQRVRILEPQRGERAEYMKLVQKNAEQNLRAYLVHQEAQETASASALNELAAALDLPYPPHRIECYDNSHIQGTNAVSSMVVFIEGRSKKSDYRHFKIQAKLGNDDFAMMQETLRRRLRYLRPEADATPAASDVDTPETRMLETQAAKKERFHERPDLLLIDGGKGQLSAVVAVLHEMDLWGIPIAGLAKENEWLFVPGQSEPIVLPPGSPALHLIMRVRDEAHRFAITYHRSRRDKAMKTSALDALAGVGPVRKKRLLVTFGSVAGIKRASLDEIAAVKGMTPTLASQIKAALG
jgi:excinuclease ABC subunit C